MRAAMYLRQSVDRYGNELAVTRQRTDCLALCAEREWSPVEYMDNDRSATNGKSRPRYQKMLADIRAGKVDAVVVWDLDRLHRQPIELEHFMKLADERKLKLATATGDCDLATDNGRLFARIKGAVGMAEVERKSARQKAAMAQIASTPIDKGGKKGARPWWPSRPFGLDADRNAAGKWWVYDEKTETHNTIRKHPTEAKLLADAYKRFNAGSSIRSIATGWNSKGVTTPRGNKWTPSAVHHLLASARNAGLREYDGEVVGKGTWPAIVTEEVWRRARRKLKDPARRRGVDRGRKYLLSGIARCGLCDAKLGSTVSTRKVRQYVCTKCQRINRDGEKLDQLVIERVVWRLSKPDAVKLLANTDDQDVDTDELREQRQALTDGLARLGKEFANAPAAFKQSSLDEINEKLEAINTVLEAPAKVDIFEGVIGAKDVRKAFLGLDLGRRRTIVNALYEITVNPAGKTGKVFDPTAIDMKPKQ